MDLLRKAKQGLMDAAAHAGLKTAETHDPELDSHIKKLDRLENVITDLQKNFDAYSQQVLRMNEMSRQLSEGITSFYVRSEPRQKSVQTYNDVQSQMGQVTNRVFKEDFGWEVSKIFDDWRDRCKTTRASIAQTKQARAQVSQLQEKVSKLESEKQKRNNKGQDCAPVEDQLKEAQLRLGKYTKALTNMRQGLDQKVKKLVTGRYAQLDQCFVRLMECQTDYFKQHSAITDSFSPIIGNYRKKFPRGKDPLDDPLDEPTPQAYNNNGHHRQPSHSESESSDDAHSQPDDNNADADAAVDAITDADRARAANFFDLGDDSPVAETAPAADSSNQQQGGGYSTMRERVPASAPHMNAARRSQSEPQDMSDFFSMGGSSEPSTISNGNHQNNNNNPTIDEEPPKRKDSLGMGGLLDMFGGSPTNATRSTSGGGGGGSSSSQVMGSASDLDMFGGADSSSSAVASGGDDLSDFFGASKPEGKRSAADPFDPLAGNSPHKGLRKSNTTGGFSMFGEPPSHSHGANAFSSLPGQHESDSVNQYRQQQARDKAERDARNTTDGQVESRIEAWENKNGMQRSIRALLSSLEKILWADSGWKKVTLADLMEKRDVKKRYMRAIKLVHPDRMVSGTTEQKVIARRVFEALNTAFEAFKANGGR